MSYILEALKRADAEREREGGAVPGLHTSGAEPASEADAAAPLPWRRIGLGVLLLIGLALLAWWLFGRVDSAAVVPPPMPTGASTAPAPQPVPIALAPAPGPVAVAETRPVAPAVTELVLPPAPAPVPAAREPEAAPRRSAAIPVVVPTAAVPAPAPASATAGEAASAPRVYTLAELPPEIRRELPQLVIGGSTYSSDPAQRMLIVNTQIFRENDSLMPGLTVEQIRAKAAVLKYKGYRYEIAY